MAHSNNLLPWPVRIGAIAAGVVISAGGLMGVAQAASPSYKTVVLSDAPVAQCPASLQSLIDAAGTGSTLNVPACVFRETITINKALTLSGQPGSELRGSDVWTAWTANGSTFLSQLTVPTLPVVSQDPDACGTSNKSCLWPEQVFRDGQLLTQVAAGTTPAAGQFALVSSTDRHIRLADNPSGHILEVSTRAYWLNAAADNVTIQGMSMRHAGNNADRGAIDNLGRSNWTLQNNTLAYAHSANVNVSGGANIRVLKNDMSYGGLDGMSGSMVSQGGVVQGNNFHDNGFGTFSQLWGVAGMKLANVQNFLVDANESRHNNGTGLWCDISCSAVTFTNNRVHHNWGMGILFEISDGASIHHNAIWENGWGQPEWGWGAGIVISSSANADVYANTLAWNSAGISVIAQNRPLGRTVAGNNIHDNTLAKQVINGDFGQTYWNNLALAWLSDGVAPLYDAALNNRGSGNRYSYDQPEYQSVRFSWLKQYMTLAEFHTTPGDTNGTYLTSAAMQQALTAANMPLTAEQH